MQMLRTCRSAPLLNSTQHHTRYSTNNEPELCFASARCVCWARVPVYRVHRRRLHYHHHHHHQWQQRFHPRLVRSETGVEVLPRGAWPRAPAVLTIPTKSSHEQAAWTKILRGHNTRGVSGKLGGCVVIAQCYSMASPIDGAGATTKELRMSPHRHQALRQKQPNNDAPPAQ